MPGKPALAVLLLGLIASGIALEKNWDRQHHRWFKELEQQALEDTLILTGQLEVNQRELLGIISFYKSSLYVSREEFRAYVQPILKYHRYIQAIEWVPRVPDSERKVYEKNPRLEGFQNFQFLQPSKKGQKIPAKPRAEYFPVYYVEPFLGNESALGFDLASHPAHLNALYTARDTGQIVSTGRVALLRETQVEDGIYFFAPLYGGAQIPQTVEQRRESLKGFILGAYRIKDMIDEMVSRYLTKGMNLVIFDEHSMDPERKLYGRLLENPPLEIKSIINVAGKRWLLVWQADREFQDGPKIAVAFLIAGSFLGVAIFMAIIIEILSSRTRQVEQQVRVRTGELTRANDQLRLEVDARRMAEKGLQSAKEEAELANRAKSIFLANMSHEIRTPMNAILGYTQILDRQRSLDPGQHKNIRSILASGDHLLQIINDILDISKIEAGKMELSRADFDLNELIKSVSAMIEPRCREKKLAWRVESPDDQAVLVRGDDIKLMQVLINLLGNAVKFTATGQVVLKVLRQSGDRYRFEVIDTGQGIAIESQEKIFDPFQQDSTREQKGGTGLGLAIAKRQVELMQGELTLDSAVGKGSKFAFTLHLLPAREMAAPHARVETQAVRIAAGNHIRAVVADDNEMNRDVLSKILEDAGVEVVHAIDGKEAVEQTLSCSPDIVFLDMRMPVLDGIGALKEIKSADPQSKIKIVAITASAFEHQREKIVSAGFDDFISKPFRIERIFHCLNSLLAVEFEHDEVAAPPQKEIPLPEVSNIRVSGDLLLQLKEAARLHNLTDLKNCLGRLDASDADAQTLAHHLKPCAAKFDMEKILEILEQIPDERDR